MNMIKGKMNYWEGRGKVFDFLAPDIRGYERVNEDRWFEMHQPLLLKMLNCQTGRDFFGIEHDAPLIVEIRKNVIKYALETKVTTKGLQVLKISADFRVGAKWANYIRFNWLDFVELAECFNWQSQLGFSGLGLLSRVKGECVMASGRRLYDTLTAYPDPDPETNGWDGNVQYNSTAVVWATIRAASGTTTVSHTVPSPVASMTAGTSSNLWTTLARLFADIYTAALPDDATIDSATLSLCGFNKDDPTSNSPQANIYGATVSSHTEGTASDFQSAGATAFSDSNITYANWTTDVYNVFTLNASGLAQISKTGYSTFCMREAVYDAGAATPTWASAAYTLFRAYGAEETGTDKDIKLTVTYTPAGGGDTSGMFLVF